MPPCPDDIFQVRIYSRIKHSVNKGKVFELCYATEHGLCPGFSVRRTGSDSALPGGSSPLCPSWPRPDRLFKRGCLKTPSHGMKAVPRGSRPHCSRSAFRTSAPRKKKLFETNPYLKAAVETLGVDRTFRPGDSTRDRYPPHPSQLLHGEVMIEVPGNPGCSAPERRAALLCPTVFYPLTSLCGLSLACHWSQLC